MDSVPNSVDRAARGVGTQIPTFDERSSRNGVVGVQCSGSASALTKGMYEKAMTAQASRGVLSDHERRFLNDSGLIVVVYSLNQQNA